MQHVATPLLYRYISLSVLVRRRRRRSSRFLSSRLPEIGPFLPVLMDLPFSISLTSLVCSAHRTREKEVKLMKETEKKERS